MRSGGTLSARGDPRIARAVALILCLPLCSFGCDRIEPEVAPQSVPRYWSLVRAADRGLGGQQSVELTTETLDGDSRTAIVLRAGQTLELPLVAATGPCKLRFGLGVAGVARADGHALELRLVVRRGDSDTPLAPEAVRRDTSALAAWSDREISLPGSSGSGSWSLLAAVSQPEAPSEGSKGSALLWGSPHLVCEGWVPRPPPSAPPDVVLISIDTLRPDHLGLYGYALDTSPNLDAFAARSLVFDNSISPAPYTLPSHATMLTGLLPQAHGAGHRHQNQPVDSTVPTLAEVLGGAGYRTLAFTGGGLISRASGLDRGFDEWTERWTRRKRASLDSVLPEVFDALAAADGAPLFLFLHTYDVHGPYQQPAAYRRFHGASYSAALEPGDWQMILDAPHHAYQHFERFSGLADVLAAYDSSIRMVDERISALLDYLERLGRLDGSLVIVTADHGESLFDHRRYVSHGHSLHDVELRVPLIVKPPGAARPRRLDRLVGLIDIAPTVLDAAGLPLPDGLQGSSLLAAGQPDERPMLGESGITGARFVRSRRWKLVTPTGAFWNLRRHELFGAGADRFETGWQIYDLANDPRESRNLAGSPPSSAIELRGLLALLRSTDPPGRLAGNDVELTDAMLDSLRALGYVQ
jgi:arylsulfatase A-like enzyme